jgi:hypothetical protein
MFVDKDLMIAEKEAIVNGSNAIGDVVDLAAHGRLAGEPVYIVIQFTTPPTGNGDKVVFSVQTSTAENFTGENVVTRTLVVSPEVNKGDNIALGLEPLILPVNIPFAERYLRVYTTATVENESTTGKVNIMLVLDAQTAGLQKQATDV